MYGTDNLSPLRKTPLKRPIRSPYRDRIRAPKGNWYGQPSFTPGWNQIRRINRNQRLPDNLQHRAQPVYASDVKSDHPVTNSLNPDLPGVWYPLDTPESQPGKDRYPRYVPRTRRQVFPPESAACGRLAKGETPHSHLYHCVACARPLRGLIGIASFSLRFPKQTIQTWQ